MLDHTRTHVLVVAFPRGRRGLRLVTGVTTKPAPASPSLAEGVDGNEAGRNGGREIAQRAEAWYNSTMMLLLLASSAYVAYLFWVVAASLKNRRVSTIVGRGMAGWAVVVALTGEVSEPALLWMATALAASVVAAVVRLFKDKDEED